MWGLLGAVTVFWTTFVFLSAWILGDQPPCKLDISVWPCYGRLAFAPWFLIAAFIWWAISYLLYAIPSNARADRYRQQLLEILDPEQEKYLFEDLEFYYKGLSPYIVVLLTVIIILTTIGAYKGRLYTLAMLNIAALSIFLHATPQKYFDAHLLHKSRLDDIRLPVSSPSDQCLVYILPSRGYEFDARYTTRIDNEYESIDLSRSSLEPLDMRKEQWSLEACRKCD